MTTQIGAAPELERLSRGVVRVLETYDGVDDVFSPRALFDINVPFGRFQLAGTPRFIAWLQSYCPQGYSIAARPALPTASGFVLELEGEYTGGDGRDLFFRNLYVCRVDGGRITAVSFWCTGDWDPHTRAHNTPPVPLEYP